MGARTSAIAGYGVAAVVGAVAYRALAANPSSSSPSSSSSSASRSNRTTKNSNEQDEEEMDPNDVVREAYHQTVTAPDAATVAEEGCCTIAINPGDQLGYSQTEMAVAAAADVKVTLGCGTPLHLANLKEGETVVDLGSGAGIDCILAARQVGAAGQVIGVDMTPSMLSAAKKSARKIVPDNPARGVAKVSFRLGEIEHLPVADNTADCVISNCVINMSSNKQQVYEEIFRVLRPGGRFAMSDVLKEVQDLPEHLRTSRALACCVAGASTFEEQSQLLRSVGFVDVAIVKKPNSREYIKDWMPGQRAEDYIVSADVTALKPQDAGLPFALSSPSGNKEHEEATANVCC